jgi:hypothetical protein
VVHQHDRNQNWHSCWQGGAAQNFLGSLQVTIIVSEFKVPQHVLIFPCTIDSKCSYLN